MALAGVGDVGKYFYEELIAADDFDVVILSRSVRLAPARKEKPNKPEPSVTHYG